MLIDLLGFGFGDIAWVYATNPFSLGVYGQHDVGGLLSIHTEETLKYLNDKLHGRYR